jgi:hypothetical protein
VGQPVRTFGAFWNDVYGWNQTTGMLYTYRAMQGEKGGNMTKIESNSTSKHRLPWHIWAVAVLAVLWNGSGAYTIMMAQAGRLPNISADEAAYYAAQSTWFIVATDLALVASIAAALTLLLRSKSAVWLFGFSLTAVLVTNIYDFAAGTSRIFASRGALIVTCIIVLFAILELAYAWAMKRRAVLV